MRWDLGESAVDRLAAFPSSPSPLLLESESSKAPSPMCFRLETLLESILEANDGRAYDESSLGRFNNTVFEGRRAKGREPRAEPEPDRLLKAETGLIPVAESGVDDR
jgi:hypothetical protein